jgi:preprotein translocase subunit SecA
MNAQRTVIYKKRKHALFGERLAIDIDNMIYDTSESIVNEYQSIQDYEGFKLDLIRFLSIDSPVDEAQFKQLSTEDLTQKVYTTSIENYKIKNDVISQKTYPVIKDVFEKQSATYENIVIPFSDGIKTLQVVTNLKEAYDTEGGNIPLSIEKGVTLAIIDSSWKENLRELDDLKQSVQNATYEQKDPLLIYKFESFNLFKQMMEQVNKDIVSFLMKANLPEQTSVKQEQHHKQERLQTGRQDVSGTATSQQAQKPKVQPVRVEQKVGRNEACPCGSGKKFKQCHGK